MTRVPPIAPPTELLEQTLKSYVLHYELVTPMYGGGVQAHTVDQEMPIRASAIRGQLRFWWRLLAKHQWELGNVDAIRKAEFALWGGMGEKDPIASKVLLRVVSDPLQEATVAQWAQYDGKRLKPESWAAVPYALFPAQGDLKKNEEPHELLKVDNVGKPNEVNFLWSLHVCFTKDKPLDPEKPKFDPNISEDEEKQVWETIRWWSFFGGVGARTRRGLGAVYLVKTSDHVPIDVLKPITAEEARAAGCQLVIKGASASPYSAWQSAVNKLRDFRQGSLIGRNGERGRSFWPEPDAIRGLTGCSLDRHRNPTSTAGSIFPRAAFGLPIIFHFTEKKEDTSVVGMRNHEPKDTSLNPVINGDTVDRMASPVILRPMQAGKNTKGEALWAAGALLLPHLKKLDLELVYVEGKQSISKVTYYDPAQADNILPIKAQNGTTPLQAFMTYFAK